jgi:hypothetical protein
MSLRLQTEDSKIKEYQTVYGVGCVPLGTDYYDYEKWVSNCGTEWHKEPEPHEECDHLKCAIHKAESERVKKTGAIYLAAIAAIFFVISAVIKPLDIIRGFSFILFVIFALASIVHLGIGLKGEENWNDLIEFKDKGTIKGIKAWRISDDPYAR